MIPVAVRIRLLVALGLLAPAALRAQERGAGVVKGRIIDAGTEQQLANAAVVVLADVARTRSDSLGRFLVVVRRSGVNVITVKRLGYTARSFTIDVPAGDTAEVMLPLEQSQSVTELDTVTVEAKRVSSRLEAFEKRRHAKNGGWYVTRAEFEKQMPVETSDLLRRAPGVEVVKSGVSTMIVSRRGTATTTPGAPGSLRGFQPAFCAVSIGVDGRVMDSSFSINNVALSDIEGIEVYSGWSTIPMDYRGQLSNNFCGLVMIWTRAQ
jgi:CarboxypepD_reg-like domain/TonB-dependent Receptor Plug Domain